MEQPPEKPRGEWFSGLAEALELGDDEGKEERGRRTRAELAFVPAEQVAEAWINGGLVEKPVATILAEFCKRPDAIIHFVKGKIRNRLSNRFAKDASFECEAAEKLEGGAFDAAQALYAALVVVDNANKVIGGDHQMLVDIALVELT